ncbi:PAS domain S-box protein [Janthinobacterium sp. SUN120]|uniref:hybrid sensor histidine kinase/response regulator n=1 Tax=Janthinobacterium sp. SUN120 TaxID=3004099 RepID=UPI0025B1CDA5|nr:PAS domain S-box protein [Janthinobacterium sp. SUN120]MDN2714050.1 PAS domain S-box protein [Janthinobacterium sp. SUN120]
MNSTPATSSQAGASGVAFLLQLERRLRLLQDTGEILALSAQLLGQRLGAQQVACFDIDQALQCPTLQHAWSDGLAPGAAGEYFLGDCAAGLAEALAAGQALAVSDVMNDPRTAQPAAQATFARLGIRAFLNIPIAKDGQLAALFVVHSRAARLWHADEIELAVQVSERVWSTILRAQAEARLRALSASMETQVAERTREFGRTWNVSPDLLGVLNLDGYFEHSNPAWQATLGWSAEEIRTTKFLELIHPDDLPRTHAAWDAANQGQPALRFENRYRHKLGGWHWLSWVAVPEGDKVYCSARDITVEKKLEADLAARNSERERLWRSAQDLMVAIDAEGCFAAVNPAAGAILGWLPEEMLGRSIFDFVLPEDAAATREALLQVGKESMPSFENRYRHRDGGHRWLSWVAAIEGDLVFATGRHVTLEKEAQNTLRRMQESLRHSEMALLQSQKLEALGKLTGGVAHDFNNVLQIISGNLQLLQLGLDNDPLAAKRIASASAAVERGAKLSAQLLAFARRQPLKPLVTDLAQLLRATEELLRRATGETIETRLLLADDCWRALVDPHQLENVILNLAINARDAMEGQGQLTIELSNCVLGSDYAARHADVAPGDYVQLAVSDTGTGIPAELLDKIFEPFFTTKKEGEGTGLGLSMAYGFLRQSGGHLTVDSLPGHGSTFRIYLPRSLEAETELPLQLGGPVLGGKETILVVEDDVQVQTTVVDMLRGLGYAVLRASDGESALAIIGSGVPIDLLFTDVVMPGKVASTALARQARVLLPQLAVLFTSGYTQDAIMQGGRLEPGVELLSKPYRREDLARRIRHLLANGRHVTALHQYRAQLAPQPAPPLPAGRHILLVEDNADARAMTGDLLSMLGHTVLAVGTAEEALPLLDTPGLDLLLTDISLPRMSGAELAELAARDHPRLEVVFSTGHAPANSGVLDPQARFLVKPFTVEQLQQALLPTG